MLDALTSEAPDAATVAYAKWGTGNERQEKPLSYGRYLIGTSPFAQIRLRDYGAELPAVLEIKEKTVELRCISHQLPVLVAGQKLAVGQSITIGDIVEVLIGKVTLQISLALVSETRDHQKDNHALTVHSVDELKQYLARKLLDELNLTQIDLKQLDSPELRERARLKLRKLISDKGLKEISLTPEEIEKQIFDEVFGLGALEDLLADEKVTEIMVNRRDQIYVEKAGQLTLSKTYFSSDQTLLNVIERIVTTIGRRIDTSSPIVDARLLDGSRVNAVIPPLALRGPCLTIRRFSKKPIAVQDLVKWGSIPELLAPFLKVIVEERKNLLISGGTGSGKTTLLNALSSFIPDGERIVTVEDAAELQLQQSHVISLETRPPNLEGVGAITIRDLVKNTLRMRPDRIIVGECRGGEAIDMLQAMNTGHDGSMTTAHANTPEDMLRRLETMVMMSGLELPLKAIREQIASAVTVVVQQTRKKSGKRFVTDVSWIRGLIPSSGEYDIKPLFERHSYESATFHWESIQEFCSTETIELARYDFAADFQAALTKELRKS